MSLLGFEFRPYKLSLILPVGISFYTFQALGYSIDVYKGKTNPRKHFGKYALFVSFFPQLVAGPIERIENLMPQFDEEHKFEPQKIKSGLLLIAQGLVKKIVIADRLAFLVNVIYNSPAKYNGIHFVVATVFFAFQIYCDFSGYSDIAIGSARLLGYNLMENFKRPYLSSSISEFWKRWHISLTSWFRDNVYIPLGGNKRRHFVNILIVFIVSGLWHGANMTFVLWGLLNGLYQVAGIALKPVKQKIKDILGIEQDTFTYQLTNRLVTFAMVCFAWVFFRANSLEDLKIILGKLLIWNTSSLQGFNLSSLGMDKHEFVLSVILIFLLLIYEIMQERSRPSELLRREPLIARWFVYLSVAVIIILFGVYGDANGTQFIYFQF